MIILPPEEKKSSPVAKWIFRFLVLVCVLIGFALGGINLLSGTTDAHRHGLEQAFSGMLRTKVEISTLKTFNIFPQFLIETGSVRGIDETGRDTFHAKEVQIAFSMVDIMREKGLIEDLRINDLFITPEVIGPQELALSTVGLIPATPGTNPYVELKGRYGATPLKGSVDLTREPGAGRPAYRFSPGNAISLELGRFHITGKIGDQSDQGQEFRDIVVRLDGEDLLTGSMLVKPVDRKLTLQVKFTLGHSSGTLYYAPASDHQRLTFDTLALSDFTGEKPAWAKLFNAWQEDVVRVSSSQKDAKVDQLSLKIKRLEGDVAGEDIKGEFVYAPDHITGWWQGKLTQIAVKDKKVPAGSAVTCALLRLKPAGENWISDYVLTVLPPLTLSGTLTLAQSSGKITYKTDRLHDGVTAMGKDLGAFSAYREELGIADHNVCSDLDGFAAVKPAAEKTHEAAQP